jgi:hypothetical protein
VVVAKFVADDPTARPGGYRVVVVLAVASPFSGTSDLIRLGQSRSDLGSVSLIRSEQPSPSQPLCAQPSPSYGRAGPASYLAAECSMNYCEMYQFRWPVSDQMQSALFSRNQWRS